MQDHPTPWRSYYPVLVALIVGFGVTWYLSWFLLEEARQDLHNHFELLVDPQVNSLRANTYRHLDILNRLDDFFTASEKVTVEEFRRFNDQPLRTLPGVRSVFFAPRVPADRVAHFLAEAQEMDPDYTLRGSDPAGFRFPVYYQESTSSRWNLKGLDLRTVPGLREALVTAREERRISALFSREIQELGIPRQYMVALDPVFTSGGRFSGYVGILLDRRRLLRDGLIRGDPKLLRRFELYVLESRDAKRKGTLFFFDPQQRELTSRAIRGSIPSFEDRIVHRRTIKLGDRSLTLVFGATSFYRQQLEDRTSRLVFFGGCVFTIMIAVYLFMLKRAQRRARAQARTDDLTGLYARRYWLELLAQEMERVRRYGTLFSVIQLDLDHFKSVNDRYGHPSGDRVLETVGQLIQEEVRDPDFSCRYGGEEFAVLLPETRLGDAESVAERLREQLASQTFHFNGDVLTVTASFGVAEYHPGENQEEILKRVDEALYRAKDRGRNCVVSASPPSA